MNPPVHAWAALEVFALDGGTDFDFLGRVFDKLMMNFTWWINREDADGSNLFEGGFLGLDNIGPLDRSHLPVAGQLEQADATGWMATYALSMGTMAAILYRAGHRSTLDLVQTFLERFADIRAALDATGMWDERDGMFYDRIITPGGTVVPVRVRSMVGMIPMLAIGSVGEDGLDRSLQVGKQFARFLRRRGLRDAKDMADAGMLRGEPGNRQLLLGVLGVDQAVRLFGTLFNPAEFLSPYGLRSMSAYHREHPYVIDVEGTRATVDYEPAESTVDMFGGNSNWRGPIWFPLNFLLASALERYYFLVGADGRRPCYGGVERLQRDPRWRDNITFNEYFHGDNGAGLGAAHQTGWTGLVAAIIRRRHRASPPVADIIQRLVSGSPS